MQSNQILLTGASGFIGSALASSLVSKGYGVIGVSRNGDAHLPCTSFVANITPATDWSVVLKGVDVVIHAAGRVHIMADASIDPLGEYRYQNVDTTLHLAKSAAAIGVKRFIFISTIKVFGEETIGGNKFFADSTYAPSDPYGISKMEAEIGLLEIAKLTKLEVVIIRLPLVYGPGVKANFLSMMSWLSRKIPLPLGGITRNLRSFVYLGNLIDLIATCIYHPSAANQMFLVSDDEDMSTTELLVRMAGSLGQRLLLIPIPSYLIVFGARLIGKPEIARRLCGSLQVDITKTKNLLSWSPPVSVSEGLHQTAKSFLKDNFK